MSEHSRIACRAQIHPDCYHGRPTETQFGDDLHMGEDGTYRTDESPLDGEEGSIVCDVCYILLMPFTPSGQGLNDELDDAIAEFKEEA